MKKKATIFLIPLLVGLIIGFVGGMYYSGDSGISTMDSNVDLLRQLEKAKAFFPPTPEMFSVSGSIVEINGNKITVKTFQSPNPFEDIPEMREIIVTQFTKITKQENKDPDDYQKEFEAYNKRFAEQTADPAINPLLPPNPFEVKTIDVNELKVNDQIFVDAGKNIKSSKSFEAVSINLQGFVATGVPPAPPANIPIQAPPTDIPGPTAAEISAQAPPTDIPGPTAAEISAQAPANVPPIP